MVPFPIDDIVYMQYHNHGRGVVDFYRKENGECPVELFIDSLDMKLQAKALRVINMLKAYGNTLREPYSKPLKGGIFELRTSFGSDTIRLFFSRMDTLLYLQTVSPRRLRRHLREK